MHKEATCSDCDALRRYLARDAEWQLALAPLYREYADFLREGMDQTDEFLTRPQGSDVQRLRSEVASLSAMIRSLAGMLDQRAEVAELTAMENLPEKGASTC